MGVGAPGFVRPFKQAFVSQTKTMKSMAVYISISVLSVYLKTVSCLTLRRIVISPRKIVPQKTREGLEYCDSNTVNQSNMVSRNDNLNANVSLVKRHKHFNKRVVCTRVFYSSFVNKRNASSQ